MVEKSSGLMNVSPDKLPGLTKLVSLSWMIMSIIILLFFFAMAGIMWSKPGWRETFVILVLGTLYLSYTRVKIFWHYRHASIGVMLNLDTDRVFLKKIKKINYKLNRTTNEQKINKLKEKKSWYESYLSDELKETIKKEKEDEEKNKEVIKED